MIAVLIILASMSIPLTGIVASTVLKWRRLDGGSPRLEGRMRALEAENADLRARLEVLETIATSLPAPSTFALPPAAPDRA